MAKAEIALKDNQDIATLDSLKELLRGNVKVSDFKFESNSTENAQQDILEQILSATDDDELENIGSLPGWQNYLGVPMGIYGFRPQKSEKEGDGPPFYLVCDLNNMITGDNISVAIGSWGVIAQLINLAERGQIPGAIRILQKGEETKAGRNPLRLVSTQREIDERTAAKAKERL